MSPTASKKDPIALFCVLLGLCVREFDASWLSTEPVKLLCSPSVVSYTVEVW